MAYHLSEILADESARVLFVCGLSHAPGVVARLGQEPAAPFGRRPRLRAVVYHLHPESAREVLTEIFSVKLTSQASSFKDSFPPVPTIPRP